MDIQHHVKKITKLEMDLDAIKNEPVDTRIDLLGSRAAERAGKIRRANEEITEAYRALGEVVFGNAKLQGTTIMFSELKPIPDSFNQQENENEDS